MSNNNVLKTITIDGIEYELIPAVATSTEYGGVKANPKTNVETEEVKMDPSTGLLYSKKVPTKISDFSDSNNYILKSEVNNTVAGLDSNGIIPLEQLPDTVNEYEEYDSKTNFPKTGVSDRIYLAKDTNISYRWSGTQYSSIGSSLALGETNSTAYPGNKGAEDRTNINNLKNSKQDNLTAGSNINISNNTIKWDAPIDGVYFEEIKK